MQCDKLDMHVCEFMLRCWIICMHCSFYREIAKLVSKVDCQLFIAAVSKPTTIICVGIQIRAIRNQHQLDNGFVLFLNSYLAVIRLCRTRGRTVRWVCWKMSHYRRLVQQGQNHEHNCNKTKIIQNKIVEHTRRSEMVSIQLKFLVIGHYRKNEYLFLHETKN